MSENGGAPRPGWLVLGNKRVKKKCCAPAFLLKVDHWRSCTSAEGFAPGSRRKIGCWRFCSSWAVLPRVENWSHCIQLLAVTPITWRMSEVPPQGFKVLHTISRGPPPGG